VHAWILVKALSDAGDAVWTIALAWTAVQVSSPAVAGLIVAAGTVPRAAVLLFGGVVADRLDARRVMIAFNAVRIAVLLCVAIWTAHSSPAPALLFAAAIAFGMCDAVYEPSAMTIGRQLVRVGDLPRYSALSQTATRLATMAGAAGGGFLVAHAGLGGSATANGAAFALVIAFIAIWLRPRYLLPRAQRESMLRGIGRGFSHLRTTPSVRTLVLCLSGLNLAVGPALGIGVALRASAEGWGPQAAGLLQAMVGLGAAIGAMAVLRWRPRYEARAGFCVLIVQGLGIVAAGLGGVWPTGAACMLIGMTAGYASVLLSATFAGTVDPAYLGRMGSITRLGDDCLMPIAMAAFGALAAVTAGWVPFLVYGCAMTIAMALALRNRTLWHMSLGGARREETP
jgi:MFS family permease